MSSLKRHVIQGAAREQTIGILQACLADLIDLSLQGKQAHWNVVGPNFRSIHLQLDEIIDQVRLASDDIAERIVTLGDPAEGRVSSVASNSRLEAFPAGLQTVTATVTLIADRLEKTIAGLRSAIEAVGELDPISEDLLIAQTSELEKSLWMVQAQEA